MPRGLPDSWGLYFARRGLRSARNTLRSASRRSGGLGRPSFGYTFKSLTIYNSELDRLLNMPGGDVWRELETRGRLALAGAKAKVGVRSGELRSSIYMEHKRFGAVGQIITIGARAKHALMHHEGTRPHMIFPRERQILRFSDGGRVVYTRAVRHPGTRPNRYLSTQLKWFEGVGTTRVITYGRM